MKRGIFLISFLLLMISPVYAKENRLYFTESDNRLYYESGLFQEKVFMKHEEMTPGSVYQDSLKIENGTNTTYTLYMKAVPKNQGAAEEALLKSIKMVITVDGKTVYDGLATGEELNNQGIDLQEAILLGDFSPNKTATMNVETKLLENYNDTENSNTSSIDWSFYASYGDNEVIPINPYTSTMKKNYSYFIPIIVVALLLLIVLFKKKEAIHQK